jgi:hypothetical protein
MNGVNRSQAIRDYLEANPGATPKQIKLALHDQGIEVTEGLVSVVKYGKKKAAGEPAGAARGGRGGRGGRGEAVRQRAAAKTVPATGNRGGAFTADDLLEVKRLVNHLGGIDAARRALELLEQLA